VFAKSGEMDSQAQTLISLGWADSTNSVNAGG
jgi:hypothetical protein